MDKNTIKQGIHERWGETSTATLCLKLVDSILSLDPGETAALSYTNLLDMLGQNELSPALLAALNVLTTSEYAILDTGGFFIDDDEESFELSPEDFHRVVRDNYLIHPYFGDPVRNPTSKVAPFFTLKDEIRSSIKEERSSW